jgi:MFS family permease
LTHNRLALLSVVFLVCFAGLASYLDEFDALIVADWGLASLWVSGILTVRFVASALGGLIAPKLQKLLATPRRIFLFCGLGSLSLLVFALLWREWALVFFGLSCVFMSGAEVLLVDTLQSEIREEGRATVMSFYGVLQNLFMIGFSLAYALILEIVPMQWAYVIFAVYGILGTAAFVILFKNNKEH